MDNGISQVNSGAGQVHYVERASRSRSSAVPYRTGTRAINSLTAADLPNVDLSVLRTAIEKEVSGRSKAEKSLISITVRALPTGQRLLTPVLRKKLLEILPQTSLQAESSVADEPIRQEDRGLQKTAEEMALALVPYQAERAVVPYVAQQAEAPAARGVFNEFFRSFGNGIRNGAVLAANGLADGARNFVNNVRENPGRVAIGAVVISASIASNALFPLQGATLQGVAQIAPAVVPAVQAVVEQIAPAVVPAVQAVAQVAPAVVPTAAPVIRTAVDILRFY